MEKLLLNLSNLIKVKTIVTLVVTAVFGILALKGVIDPDNVMVIVNDSGAPEGCGIAIPAETFMDAWEDSSCYMIECM